MMWRGLTADEVVSLWERGAPLDPIDRALLVLGTADPAITPEACVTLPLGARDRALLAIRRATLGPQLDASAECPACAAALEFPLDVQALLATRGTANPSFSLEADGIRLTLRAPHSGDLKAAKQAAAGSDVAAAETRLLSACVLSAEKDGHAMAPAVLPEAVRSAIAEAVVANEPLAEVALDLVCPSCVEDGPATADPARTYFIRRHHGLTVRANDDLAVGVALGNRSRLGLNLFLDRAPESVGLRQADLNLGLLAHL